MILSRDLIDALARVVAEAVPVLVAATPHEAAVDLGRHNLHDPFSSFGRKLPVGLPDLLYPVLERMALVPPTELVDHPALALTDELWGQLDEQLHMQRRLRESPDGSFSLVGFSRPAEGPRPEPLPDPLASARELLRASVLTLVRHRLIIPLLASSARTEAELAAAHGAGHLAVCLATALAIQRAMAHVASDPDLIRSLGWVGYCETYVLLSRALPPDGYDAAALAAQRSGYTLPRTAVTWVGAPQQRLVLVEGFSAAMRITQVQHVDPVQATRNREYAPVSELIPDTVQDFTRNGLVAVVDGVPIIRTGAPAHLVEVCMELHDAMPELDIQSWDEVVEISWTAVQGAGTVLGTITPWPSPVGLQTPPWPGDYRIRVHAVGRDDRSLGGRYRLLVWPAPTAPEIVHKATDQLGRRLRGEPYGHQHPSLRGTENVHISYGMYCIGYPPDGVPTVGPHDRGMLFSDGHHGAIVTTGTFSGQVEITVEIGGPLEPHPGDQAWDLTEEVTITSTGDEVAVWPLFDGGVELPRLTTTPGQRYRLRVSARGGRDLGDLDPDEAPVESHLVQLWPEQRAVIDLTIRIDYSQVYVYGGPPPEEDTVLRSLRHAYDSALFVGCADDLITILTPVQWNFDAPLRIEILSAPPHPDLEDWDHVVDVDLDIPHGELSFEASGGDDPITCQVPAGFYRAWIAGRGYDEAVRQCGGGADSYRLQLWRGAAPEPPELRRSWPGFATYS
ncbi:hypothetical protein [Pseudonocardia spinosispora]|uniref:hypothetical protein n=1 Tax=Pseudonocardia spinosispora TaxID=103441 RepID=UPI0004042F23|nr:hypothetical protein [Pseudonocardia spinosispora]